MSTLNKYTLLVNSSDGFEDCWNPFFKLLTTNWPNFDLPVLLNTEFKEYSYPGLQLKCTKANSKNLERRLTWSECLIEALHQIETPYVLYMQEDYFIENPVKSELIEEFFHLMENNQNIKYIGLTHFGNCPPFKAWGKDNRLLEIGQKAKYRIATQAALWDKKTLLSYLRAEESGWMFEIFGTKRAQKRKELFLTVNRDLFNPQNGAIIEYVHTGIIKGRWHTAMVPLFRRNNISMDFEKRGFYKPQSTITRKIETGKKLIHNPKYFIRGILGF